MQTSPVLEKHASFLHLSSNVIWKCCQIVRAPLLSSLRWDIANPALRFAHVLTYMMWQMQPTHIHIHMYCACTVYAYSRTHVHKERHAHVLTGMISYAHRPLRTRLHEFQHELARYHQVYPARCVCRRRYITLLRSRVCVIIATAKGDSARCACPAAGV